MRPVAGDFVWWKPWASTLWWEIHSKDRKRYSDAKAQTRETKTMKPMKLIVMHYQEEQNEPSKPESKLLEEDDEEHLAYRAKQMMKEAFDEPIDEDRIIFVQNPEDQDQYSDYQVSYDTYHILFTVVEEDPHDEAGDGAVEGDDLCTAGREL